MTLVRIVPPKPDGKVQSGFGTRVYNADGEEIPEVSSVKVILAPNDIIRAEIDVPVILDEVWAVAIMSEANMKAAAEYYGYTVTKKPDVIQVETLANNCIRNIKREEVVK